MYPLHNCILGNSTQLHQSQGHLTSARILSNYRLHLDLPLLIMLVFTVPQLVAAIACMAPFVASIPAGIEARAPQGDTNAGDTAPPYPGAPIPVPNALIQRLCGKPICDSQFEYCGARVKDFQSGADLSVNCPVDTTPGGTAPPPSRKPFPGAKADAPPEIDLQLVCGSSVFVTACANQMEYCDRLRANPGWGQDPQNCL